MKIKSFLLMLIICLLVLLLTFAQVRKFGVIGKDSQGELKGRRFALIVGISKYSKLPTSQQLKYADRDAESFYKFLRSPQGGGFEASKVKKLVNTKATLHNMKTELGKLASAAGAEDIVYIYFAGHGFVDSNGHAWLLTYDSDPDNPYATAFSMREMNNLISQEIDPRHIILITDACHSGSIGAPGRRSLGSNLINRYLSSISRAERSIFNLSASRAKEESQEAKKWGGGHGVFTYYLLRGLKGDADRNKDGLVTASEIDFYLTDRVFKATNGKQTPEAKGNYDSELTLSVISPGAITTVSSTPSTTDTSDKELETKRKRLEAMKKAAKEAELAEEAFQVASKLNTVEGWQLFIQDYPKSPRIAEAKRRLNNLKEAVTKPSIKTKNYDAELVKYQKELKSMTNYTVLALANAINRDNFTDFYSSISETWKREINSFALRNAFKSFIEQKVDLNIVKNKTPIFSKAPHLDEHNFLILKGYYSTKPYRVLFDLKYIYEEPQWKLYGIFINLEPIKGKIQEKAVPPFGELYEMTTSTIVELGNAINRDNFSNFYNSVSKFWQAQTNTYELRNAFKQFIEQKIDLTVIRYMTPIYSQKTYIDSNGWLILKGYYPTKPSTLYFDLKFVYEYPQWKLVAIYINVK